jgi:hypothetical protein
VAHPEFSRASIQSYSKKGLKRNEENRKKMRREEIKTNGKR